MTLPNGPAGLIPNIEFGVGFGDLAGLVNRHQNVVADILKAEVQLSVGWNTATAILWEGLQRGIPFVLALLQGIVQRLTNTIEQFPGVSQALDAIEHVPGMSQLQGLVGVAADQFDGTARALEQAIFNGDGTATATFNAFVTGPVSAIINNLDGTASGLLALVFNGDGTAGFATGATQTVNPLYTLVDNLDGTAMSAASALQNMASPVVGTATYALQNWKTVIGQTGVQQASQLVSSLAGIIPAALDNLDGTASALGAQIVHNLDGTATYIGQAVQSAENAALAAAPPINALIDNLDGTAMSFFHSVSQGVNNTLGGLLHAFTGAPVAGTTVTQAQQAQVTSAAAALQQRLATIGNGGEELVDIEFNAYSNGAIPGVFTTVFSPGGTVPAISGGLLTVTGNNARHSYQYNAATTLTDYQQITGAWPTLTQGSGGSDAILYGRMDAVGSNEIASTYFVGAGGWQLSGEAANSPVMLVTFADTFTPGAVYSLVCGDPTISDPYKFQMLKDGIPLPLASVTTGDTSQLAGQLYYIDTGHTTTVGGSTRSCGFGFIVGSGTNGTVSMSSFKFQDTIQSSPAVLVTTSESTTSTTYTDLATTSDEVAVNIGASGLALVSLSAQFAQSASGDGALASFLMSGANAQSAADSLAVGINAFSISQSDTIGGPFLLTDLSPGLTIFKMKYRAVAGGTATFSNRRIGVVAL